MHSQGPFASIAESGQEAQMQGDHVKAKKSYSRSKKKRTTSSKGKKCGFEGQGEGRGGLGRERVCSDGGKIKRQKKETRVYQGIVVENGRSPVFLREGCKPEKAGKSCSHRGGVQKGEKAPDKRSEMNMQPKKGPQSIYGRGGRSNRLNGPQSK